MPLGDNYQASLDAEWITPSKLEERENVPFHTSIFLSYPNYTPPAAYLPPAAAPPIDILPPAPSPLPNLSTSSDIVIPSKLAPSPSPFVLSHWRRTCANHEIWTNTIYQDELFYYSIFYTSISYQDEILSYHAAIKKNFQTGIIN